MKDHNNNTTKTCSFCSKIREFAEQDRQDSSSGITYDYYTAIVQEIVHRSGFGRRILHYKYQKQGYTLNFCPECGAVIGAEHEQEHEK